ncbi:MAG: hypothetical protein COZ59_01515 [Bacteroidetes bacterium CG_4_8_14_3_um_filter_31_14]|nr:MAG: hypothetical protein COZ59_01515 [Bacteroidetes bacterium CG_4_8_14_3_um_filter_31_14]
MLFFINLYLLVYSLKKFKKFIVLRSLPTAYCLLPTAYCLLPTVYCLSLLFIDVSLITQHDKKVSGLKFEVVKT